MIRPQLVTPPAVVPLSLGDIKRQCRVDFDDDDALLEAYIDAAIAHLDGYSGILGRCLINQVWQQSYPCWSRVMQLPFPDVSAVTVKYDDETGAEQTAASDQYEVIEASRGAVVVFGEDFSAPSLSSATELPVRIDLTAGYGDAAPDVPASILMAAKLLVAHWYMNREAVTPDATTVLPMAVDAMLAPHRRVGV